MKVLRKILLGLLCLLLILPLVAVVAVQLPAVQNRVCSYASQKVSGDIDGSLEFGEIYYALFDRVIVKDAVLKDAAGDTVAYLGKLSLNVKLLKAITGHLTVNRIQMDDILLNLEADVEGNLNLAKLFPAKETTKSKSSNGILAFFDNFLADIRHFKVDGMSVNLIRRAPGVEEYWAKQQGLRTMNWKDLHFSGIGIDITNIRYNMREQSVSLKVNGITAEESRGYKLDDLHFSAALDAAGIHVNKFRYTDNFSDLKLDYAHALFSDFSDFSDFLHKVSLDCSLNEARVCLATLGLFLPELDFLTLPLDVSGTVKGPVANMKLSSFTVDGPGNSHIEMSGQLNGLPLSGETILSANISQCHFSMADIEDIIAHVSTKPLKKGSISKFAPGTTFSFTGFMDGFFTDFVAYGGLSSAIGSIDIDLLCHSEDNTGFSLSGYMEAADFDLGHFLRIEKMGELSCYASLSGLASQIEENIFLTIDSLLVTEFGFNGYDYKGISAYGGYNSEGISASVVNEDPNLDFVLKGAITNTDDGAKSYELDLALANANLAELNFDKQEISLVSMELKGSVLQTGSDMITGEVLISGLDCTNASGLHRIGDIRIDASVQPGANFIRLNSSLLYGEMKGTVPLSSLVSDIKYALLDNKLDNLLKDTHDDLQYSGGDLALEFTVSDLRPLLAFIMPDLHVESGTSMSFRTDSTGSPTFRLYSELLSLKDIYARELSLALDGTDSAAVAAVSADLVRIGSLIAVNNTLNAAVTDNKVSLKLSYNNDSEEHPDTGNLNAILAFPDSAGPYFMNVAFEQSSFMADRKQWTLNPSSILMGKKRIAVRDFLLESGDQYLKADGIISDNPEEGIDVALHNFDMSLANIFLKDPLSLQGSLTGNAAASALLGEFKMSADVKADSVYLSGNLLGDIIIGAKWEDQPGMIDFDLTNMLGEKKVIGISGGLRTADKVLSANAAIDSLSAGLIAPFISTLMSDMSGSISLEASVDGPLDKLDITSQSGHLNNFAGKLLFTQTKYLINGDFELSPQGVNIRSARVTDEANGTGTINGRVNFDHFKDISMDIRMRLRNMLALNTTVSDNPSFYGKAVASNADITLSGPINDIMLDITATTGPSSIRIPLGSVTSATQSVLTFVDYSTRVLSTYDSLLLSHAIKKNNDKQEGNFGVKLRLRATEDADLFLDIDKNAGNTVKANGRGDIDISVLNKQFDIRGSYGVDEGSVSYKLFGLSNKNFTINEGSTVNFIGDIMNTDLNITARYDTKASITPLLADSTSSAARKNVQCLLGVTGKLSNPQLSFDVEVLDLEPSVQARIQPALMTEEKRMKQFVSVILTGNFLPDDQSGINNANVNVGYLNIGELMASQINDILEQLNIPVDLGLNYQNNDSGRDVVDVAISTQLFNNRVTINGNIGNRQYNTAGKSDVMGDIDISIKLGKKGRTKLTLFSHSADDFSSYLDQTQRNGAGISFSKEFDTFRELFQGTSDTPRRRERGDNQPLEGRPAPLERLFRTNRNQE